MGSDLRPDFVLVREADSAAIVLDVAVMFENGPDAFKKVRVIKVKKYQDIAQSLRGIYKDVSAESVVVGALGRWYPANDRICNRLCSKKYTKLMKKLIVADMVLHSRDIYVQHVSKFPQVQPPQVHPVLQRYCGSGNCLCCCRLIGGSCSPPCLGCSTTC